MKKRVRNILLAGVGGQGILRASDICCEVMMAAGYDAKKSEVHGMAQRGGCVTSHVCYGEQVFSPLAKKGDVEILVAFEKLETLRYLDFLKPDGIVIINDEQLNPPVVNLGDALYPDQIVEKVKQVFKTVRLVNASKLAVKAGIPRAANTVVLGVLASYLSFDDTLWEKVLKESFPKKLVEGNIKAFYEGKNA
jgi:indolepyruvate ferredoxin oxidoreductase, beta subunit